MPKPRNVRQMLVVWTVRPCYDISILLFKMVRKFGFGPKVFAFRERRVTGYTISELKIGAVSSYSLERRGPSHSSVHRERALELPDLRLRNWFGTYDSNVESSGSKPDVLSITPAPSSLFAVRIRWQLEHTT